MDGAMLKKVDAKPRTTPNDLPCIDPELTETISARFAKLIVWQSGHESCVHTEMSQ
jgi:hypothetical protein